MGGNGIAFDWFRGWAQFTLLVYIGLIVLTIYLMVSTIRFLKNKTQNDKELLLKLDELIRIKSQD